MYKRQAKGYTAPIWMTYNQARELGGQVRKGEHGAWVVFANTLKRTETNEETGEDEEREIPFLKGYTVFNAVSYTHLDVYKRQI